MNFIYGLVCPLAEAIRYIGKTNNLRMRLRGHVNDARAGKYRHHTANWIRGLDALGLSPSIVLLEEVAGDWGEAERRWIAKGRSEGWPLTNSTTGGDGAPEPTPEVAEAKRQAMHRLWHDEGYRSAVLKARNDPAFLAEQSERLRERWKSRPARDKMQAARWNVAARERQAHMLSERADRIKKSLTPEVIAKRNASIKASWDRRREQAKT
jgi:hypothetical protein